MAKINLTRSFTLRKRLRTIVNKLENQLNAATTYVKVSVTYPDGSVVETSDKPFNYKNKGLIETYKLLEQGNNFIITLNNLIDEANVLHARKVINELEVEKSRVSLLHHFVSDKSFFSETTKKFENFYMPDGKTSIKGIVTTNFKLIDDTDWEKMEEDCKKKIILLEDKITELNSTTIFEVPDEIINFIEENI